jgi:tyrosyl-tRNA synthetase
MNFLEELKWRNMVHDHTPNVEELISKPTIGFVGIDPTADSLHVGHLVSLFIMKHFSKFGHKPIILLGGATASVGDPSGKRKERQLLPQSEVDENKNKLKLQIQKIMGDDSIPIVDNFDWFNQMNVLDFLRNVGKLMTVNVMKNKQSVKERIDDGDGMSFTEFSYQLLQGWDFVHLFENFGCQLQFGGSDQWGNITTGISMLQKVKGDVGAGALTCPLLTKEDGTKFGKSEEGNVWLDPNKTKPFDFFQFWMNQSDEQTSKLIRIFTPLTKDEIESLEAKHNEAKHLRLLQKTLAESLTILIHGQESLDGIMNINKFLFDKTFNISELTLCDLTKIKSSFGSIKISKDDVLNSMISAGIFTSRSEARRLVSNNGLIVNKSKITELDTIPMLFGRFSILQRGKKDFNLIEF